MLLAPRALVTRGADGIQDGAVEEESVREWGLCVWRGIIANFPHSLGGRSYGSVETAFFLSNCPPPPC